MDGNCKRINLRMFLFSYDAYCKSLLIQQFTLKHAVPHNQRNVGLQGISVVNTIVCYNRELYNVILCIIVS